MLIPVILLLAIFVQIAATYFAVRLIFVTKRWFGWIIIATAIATMLAQRLITFFQWYFEELPSNSNIGIEIVGLITSIFMLVGLAWVAPVFKSIQRTKESLQKSEESIRNMFDATFEGIALHLKGNILFVNGAFARMFGYEKSELIDHSIFNLVPDTHRKDVKRKIIDEFEGTFETIGVTKQGSQINVELSGKPFELQDEKVRLLAVDDVTDRLKAQLALRGSEERLRSIFENSIIGLYQTTKNGRILMANPALVRMLGFNSFEEMTERDLGELGFNAGYPRSKFIERIERDGEVIGLESEWVREDGTVLNVRESARIIRDEAGNTLHYEGTIEDITERKKVEEALQRTNEQLRKAMEGIVQAMGMILEARDPYTAGHQRRVALLSCALAKEMDLSTEKIAALRMAAMVHDLGKISVPAEILSKPGKLTELENNMIKYHDLVGHEILRTIDFPWPVAEIVAQHHERYDGSGYPNGLKGDQITRESRILAVADVVEAITAHRPYRPALGVDKALEEIEKGSGVLFDPDVVQACSRLYREKKFVLNGGIQEETEIEIRD